MTPSLIMVAYQVLWFCSNFWLHYIITQTPSMQPWVSRVIPLHVVHCIQPLRYQWNLKTTKRPYEAREVGEGIWLAQSQPDFEFDLQHYDRVPQTSPGVTPALNTAKCEPNTLSPIKKKKDFTIQLPVENCDGIPLLFFCLGPHPSVLGIAPPGVARVGLHVVLGSDPRLPTC